MAASGPNGTPPETEAGEVAAPDATGTDPGGAGPDGATGVWDGLLADGSRPDDAEDGEGPPDDAEADGATTSDSPGDRGDQAEGDDAPKRARRGVAKLVKERDDYLDQLRRSRADFDNYRKRMQRQQAELEERAAEDLVGKLLVALDNFDAAAVHGEGFEQAHASLVAALEREGLSRISPEGQPFDPNEADAVAHEDGEGGPVVCEVLRAGYRWKGRVLRPAMVRVRG